MLRQFAWVIALGWLLLAPWAHADESSPSAQQKAALRARVEALHWVPGPVTVSVFGTSTLVVPAGFMFLGSAETRKLMALTQYGAPTGSVTALAPRSLRWLAYLQFTGDGRVRDSDRHLDANAILSALKVAAAARGSQAPTAWAEPPTYDGSGKRLEWAALHDGPGEHIFNFWTQILGRRGTTTVALLLSSAATPKLAVAQLKTVLKGYAFNSGERYTDWRPGDLVAPYGLSGLILPPSRAPRLAPAQGPNLPLLRLVLLGIVVVVVYFFGQDILHGLFRMLWNQYRRLALEGQAVQAAEPAGPPVAESVQPGEQNPAPAAAKPTPRKASLLVDLVQRSERARTAVIAGVVKMPVTTLMVLIVIAATFEIALDMDLALAAILVLYLAARGVVGDSDEHDYAARGQFRIACAAFRSASLPVLYGMSGVQLMQLIFNSFDGKSTLIRAYENHLSYLAVASKDWLTFSLPATIGLAAGLLALTFINPELKVASRLLALKKRLGFACAIIVCASSFTFLSQVPPRLDELRASVVIQAQRKKESEESKQAAEQATYLMVENMPPQDARYYREMFKQVNDTEAYPVHDQLVGALVEDSLSTAAASETDDTQHASTGEGAADSEHRGKVKREEGAHGGSTAELARTQVPAVLERSGRMTESLVVIQDLFCTVIGAQTPEIRGLAGKFVEKLVDAESEELFETGVEPVVEQGVSKVALAEARRKLRALDRDAGTRVDDAGMKLRVLASIAHAVAKVHEEMLRGREGRTLERVEEEAR